MDFQPWDNPMGTAGFEFIEYAAPDPQALGAVYRGAEQFRSPSATSVSTGKAARSGKEAARRQTIAERKAAELAAASTSSDRSTEGKDS